MREQAPERLLIHLGQDSIVMLALPILGDEYRYLLGRQATLSGFPATMSSWAWQLALALE
ncbi:hypothetical protein D3C84_1169220 [compost metagenome]